MEIWRSGMSDKKTDESTDTADVLTMAFVNIQPFDAVYEPKKAFRNGTLYPSLDKPFMCGGMRYE